MVHNTYVRYVMFSFIRCYEYSSVLELFNFLIELSLWANVTSLYRIFLELNRFVRISERMNFSLIIITLIIIV